MNVNVIINIDFMSEFLCLVQDVLVAIILLSDVLIGLVLLLCLLLFESNICLQSFIITVKFILPPLLPLLPLDPPSDVKLSIEVDVYYRTPP